MYPRLDAAAAAGVRYPDGAMTDAELRVRIRELMANGSLPGEPAPIERFVPPAPRGRRPHIFVSNSLLKEPCTICGEVVPREGPPPLPQWSPLPRLNHYMLREVFASSSDRNDCK